MTVLTWTLTAVGVGLAGLLAAAGVYAETHRAPDQP
jgi:hypothetical protein